MNEGPKSRFTSHEGEARMLSDVEIAEAAKGLESATPEFQAVSEDVDAEPSVESAPSAEMQRSESGAATAVRERLSVHSESEPTSTLVDAPKVEKGWWQTPPSASEKPIGIENGAAKKELGRGERSTVETLGEIGLPEKLGRDGFKRPRSEFLSRLRSGERPSEVFRDALQQEKYANSDKRNNFGMKSIMVGGGAGVLSLGAGIAASYGGVGAVTLGAISMPVLGVGAIGLGAAAGVGLAVGGAGWLGMKIYSSIKERRNKSNYVKKFGREPELRSR
jgi:hypothetical protein